MLPIVWKQPRGSAKPTTGYRIADDHGQDCPGEPHTSTVDEALRRAARYTRLNPTAIVTVREWPGGRVRGVASNGAARWVSPCQRCKPYSRDECPVCSGSGYVADDVIAVRA